MTTTRRPFPNENSVMVEPKDESGARHGTYISYYDYPNRIEQEQCEYAHGVRHGSYRRNFLSRFDWPQDAALIGVYAQDKKVGIWTLQQGEGLHSKILYAPDGSENGICIAYDKGGKPCFVEAVCGYDKMSLMNDDETHNAEKFENAVAFFFAVQKNEIMQKNASYRRAVAACLPLVADRYLVPQPV